MDERIENDFSYHAPSPEKIDKHETLREATKALALMYLELVPGGREQSLALTKLEEAVMWANAGVARNN